MTQTVPVEIHVKEVKLDAIHAFVKAVMVLHGNATLPSVSVPKIAAKSSAPNAVSGYCQCICTVHSLASSRLLSEQSLQSHKLCLLDD